jgi:hypothetical protein
MGRTVHENKHNINNLYAIQSDSVNRGLLRTSMTRFRFVSIMLLPINTTRWQFLDTMNGRLKALKFTLNFIKALLNIVCRDMIMICREMMIVC